MALGADMMKTTAWRTVIDSSTREKQSTNVGCGRAFMLLEPDV